MDTSDIREFFRGKSVFLTGFTGFVGKLVLEKLLRCCSEVDKVYLLVRGKRGKSVEDRVKEICNLPAFQVLKEKEPNFIGKIVALEGDIGNESLGLKHEDIYMLQNCVECVIHCAATTRFDEPLERATTINVKGTKQLLDMARKMKKLKAFVYVSTAYSFCPRKQIDEVIYDVPVKAKDLITDTNVAHEDIVKIVDIWPNTYSFSKAITENLVGQYNDLPIAIVRPSILMPSEKQPLPGWCDSYLGPIALMVATYMGINRLGWVDKNAIMDLLPVDYCVNLILAAVWDVGRETARENCIKVFNCVSGVDAPVRWSDIVEYYMPVIKTKIPSIRSMWYPLHFSVKHKVAYEALKVLFHIIPARIIDIFGNLPGKHERVTPIYEKIHASNAAIGYFSTQEWEFKNSNTKELWSRMSSADKVMFYFILEDFDWKRYCFDLTIGLRLYLLKDPMSTVPQAKTKMCKLKLMHYIFVGVVLCSAITLLYSILI